MKSKMIFMTDKSETFLILVDNEADAVLKAIIKENKVFSIKRGPMNGSIVATCSSAYGLSVPSAFAFNMDAGTTRYNIHMKAEWCAEYRVTD